MKYTTYVTPPPTDSRHHPRFDFTTPIRLNQVGSSDYFQGQTSDFSADGIRFITSNMNLKPEMLLEITLWDQSTHSDETALKSCVKIVRVTPLSKEQQVEVSASIGHWIV